MVWRLAALAVASAIVAGCGGADAEREAESTTPARPSAVGGEFGDPPQGLCGPDSRTPPCARGAKVGVEYPYVLLTHCGIVHTYFDGRRWLAEPPLSGGHGNAPRGWGNPTEEGWMRLDGRSEATFRGRSGHVARFVPAPPSYEPQLCA